MPETDPHAGTTSPPPAGRPSAFLVLLCLGGMAVGLWVLVPAWETANKSVRAAAWPAAVAKVGTAELLAEEYNGRDCYRLDVHYTYEVDGVAHAGENIAFGYTHDATRGRPESFLQELRSGAEVLVRYDPADPATAVLSHGVHRELKTTLAVGAIITAVAAAALLHQFLPLGRNPASARAAVALSAIGFAAYCWVLFRNDTTLVDNLTVQ